MRRRDTIVDTLLGILLVLIFFARCSAIALVVWFGLMGLESIIRLAFPNWTLPVEFLIFGAWTLIAVRSGIGHARQGSWRNAFLTFLLAPLMGFAWFTRVESSIGAHSVFLLAPVLMVITIGDNEGLGRLKFLLVAAVAGAALSANCGLLGNGTLLHTVANCVLAVSILLWIATIRNKYKTDTSAQSFSLPPAGA
jgi:hypothetical protein